MLDAQSAGCTRRCAPRLRRMEMLLAHEQSRLTARGRVLHHGQFTPKAKQICPIPGQFVLSFVVAGLFQASVQQSANGVQRALDPQQGFDFFVRPQDGRTREAGEEILQVHIGAPEKIEMAGSVHAFHPLLALPLSGAAELMGAAPAFLAGCIIRLASTQQSRTSEK